MEATITDLQLNAPGSPPTYDVQADEIRKLREDLTTLRQHVDGINRGGGAPPKGLHPKDCMPGILGNNYKQDWRTWSYKARDWFSQFDSTLMVKLETIETQTQPLSPEFIEGLEITPQADAEIRRLLVHKLEGDPAEVIRTQASQGKSGLEQYRCLAQLCDPAAGGRNLLDAKHLFHPPPASSLQTLPARIAE